MAPEVGSSHCPLSVLLGQSGLLSFPFGKDHRATSDAWHMCKKLIHERNSLILIKPSLSGQRSKLSNRTVTENFEFLNKRSSQ